VQGRLLSRCVARIEAGSGRLGASGRRLGNRDGLGRLELGSQLGRMRLPPHLRSVISKNFAMTDFTSLSALVGIASASHGASRFVVFA